MRSKWKGDLITHKMFQNFPLPLRAPEQQFFDRRVYRIYNKAFRILPSFIGSIFRIHRGLRKLFTIKITSDMVFRTFGEFILTRSKHEFRSTKKKGGMGGQRNKNKRRKKK